MNRFALSLFSASTFACFFHSAHALDLTPTAGARELEGVKIPVIYFADGSQTVTFQPPARWETSGGGASLSFFATTLTDALIQLRVFPGQPRGTTAPEDLEKWCRLLLPQDAAQVTLDSEATGTFTLRALPCREYNYTYAAQGRRFNTCVAVVDLTPQQRFVLTVSARVGDFKTTRETAIRSMFSFSWRD